MSRLLAGYCVVELGDPGAMFAGKILGDMGAEVVRVVPADGDPWRARPPLVRWGDAQVSAQWLAYNTSKSLLGIALDNPEGRRIFERLLERADIVIAGGPPAALAAQRLLPDELRASRRKLVALAMTPFGLSGPKKDWLATDLVLEAAGGMLFVNGDEDRPPVRISEEMAWAQGGSQAAFVALAALHSAQQDGIGESIDFSLHETIVGALIDIVPWWRVEQRRKMRHAKSRQGRNVEIPQIWHCKDGYVCYRLSFGRSIGKRNLSLVRWMANEGDDGLLEVDWEKISTLEMTQQQADGYVQRIGRFFRSKTRAELYAGARERHMLLFPVAELGDVLASEQLAARGFFRSIADPSGRAVRFPGALFKALPEATPFPSAPPHAVRAAESIE
jgi:crotonobetainyl-CoA:carnitine CoA-transferase CaiB-like acyl-CoA transferase